MSLPASTDSASGAELRHVTSSLATPSPKESHRLSSRGAPHLQTGPMRRGSRSPTSIPSSPTSIRSSSSAIFERDIEPIVPPSPPHSIQIPNPHRIARGKATEQLELSVPSVLDSAAEILATTSSSPEDDAASYIAVLAPAVTGEMKSGLGSPISARSRSRSSSPQGVRISSANSLLFSSGPIAPLTFSPSEINTSPMRPTIQTAMGPPDISTLDTPAIVTPTSAYFSAASTTSSSPTTTTVEHPPPVPTISSSVITSSPIPASLSISHPPSPNIAAKHLSFMSYSDLLASTPASMLTLSSLTTSASIEPPPHIPSVSGFTQASASASSAASVHGMGIGGTRRDSIALLDDIGGEWEREGLGRGLEERLEALMVDGKA